MGFLDRDRTGQQSGALSEAHPQADLSLAKPIDEELKGKQISEIAGILDSLPQDFFSRYLGLVSRDTGFSRRISLYVDGVSEALSHRLDQAGANPREELPTASLIDGDRPPFPPKSRHSLSTPRRDMKQIHDELFWEGRLVVTNYTEPRPLFGLIGKLDDPKDSGFSERPLHLGGDYMPERPEPAAGIGVQFSRRAEIGPPTTIGARRFSTIEDGNCTLYTTSAKYDRIYLDLVAPNVAVITNNNGPIWTTSIEHQKIEMNNFKALDDALEKAFESPLRVTERRRFTRSDRSSRINSPRSSNEANWGGRYWGGRFD